METEEKKSRADQIGAIITGHRESRGWTKAWLGKMIGGDGAWISKFEHGQREPSVEVLMKLADLFEVPVGELLGEPAARNIRMERPSVISPSPLNPRKKFDEESLSELAASIYEDGVVQPVVCRITEGDRLELVCGERRWRASKKVEEEFGKLSKPVEIPVIVRTLDDRQCLRIMMAENLQRADMTPLEEAQGYDGMKAMGMSVREIARDLGVPKTRVDRFMRLLDLPKVWQERVNSGEVPLYVANEALKVSEPEQREKALEVASSSGSAIEAQRRIRMGWLRPKEEKKRWIGMADDIRKNHGEATIICDYEMCRSIFPQDVTVLGPMMTAANWELSESEPASALMAAPSGNGTWADLADRYEVPLYAVCDGVMNLRTLVRTQMVMDAARVAHSASPSESPFKANEDQVRKEQQAAKKRQEEEQEQLDKEREADVIKLISQLEGNIQTADQRSLDLDVADEMVAEATAFCITAGILGFSGEESPVVHILSLLDRLPSANGEPLENWPESRASIPGISSLCVCAWTLYWIDQWDADPKECPAWKRVAAIWI